MRGAGAGGRMKGGAAATNPGASEGVTGTGRAIAAADGSMVGHKRGTIAGPVTSVTASAVAEARSEAATGAGTGAATGAADGSIAAPKGSALAGTAAAATTDAMAKGGQGGVTGAAPPRGLMAALAALVAVFFAASLLIGPAGLAPAESLWALIAGGEGAEALVMREIRLPRAVLAVLVGASLGMAGAAMQGFLRNPLAEPGLIGVSGMAALGAVLALQLGLVAAFAPALPLAALAGAALSGGLVLWLAGPGGGSLVLILAGIAISALAGAATALVLNLSPNPFAAAEIVFWTMGSLADRSWVDVALALPVMALGWVCLMSTRRGLDALTLGEDAAAALGVRLDRLRLVLVAGVAAAVGAAVAVAGVVGFVGLVVPHLLRRAVGARPGALLPAAALGGAALVLAADIAVRLILPDRDLKLGVLLALVGAPVFLHLIWRSRGVGG